MSDKYCGLYVTFENEMSLDEVKNISTIICSIRGVACSDPNLADVNHHHAYKKAKHEIYQKLFRLIEENKD